MKIKLGNSGWVGRVDVHGRGEIDTTPYYDGTHLLVDDVDVVKALVQQHNFPMLDVIDDGGKDDFAIINFRHHMSTIDMFKFFDKTINQGYKFLCTERCRVLFGRECDAG